jgi:formate C-acetyltransferase
MSEKVYLPEGIQRETRTEMLNNSMRGTKPAICVERARLVTESHKMTEGEPTIIRRAKALSYILDNMTIFIHDEELIVGNHASKQRWAPMFPEVCSFSKKELDLCPVRKVDTLQISEEDKTYLLEEIYPYWENKKLSDLAGHYFKDDLLTLLSHDIKVFDPISRTRSGYGHYVPNIKKIIDKGFIDIEKQAKENMDKLSLLDAEYATKTLFYKSVIIICQAMKRFAQRYSSLAKKMANEEKDSRRKKELELIASVCEVVPYYPAQTYHQVLQSYWFTLLVDYIFQNGSAISAGRFDQYIYPCYKKDIEAGRLTRDEAQELLEALLVKHCDIIKAGTFNSVKNNGGFSTAIHLSVGGLDEAGNNASNELTFLVLEADRNVFNFEPNIGIRISRKTPDAVIEKAIETLVIKEGGKYPIFNDDAVIPALCEDGVSIEASRDYAVSGCVEMTPSGNCMGITNACYFNVAKCLELALNNGVCMLTGKRLGPETGNALEFTSFEQIKTAFSEQMNYFADRMILALNTIIKAIAEHSPHIYCSLLLDGCLESGADSAAGGAIYNYVGVQGIGIIDAADSLTALKKLVFDEKKVSMSELIKALQTNFADNEVLRQILVNHAPKYGNDDNEADELACFVSEKYCSAVKRGRDFRGGQYRAGLFCLSSNVPFGKQTAALPSGRLSETPLGDGGISPKHGMDICGPTAAIKSVAKINHALATNGINFNQKYLPSLLKKPYNRQLLINTIRTYFGLGGFQIQFNVVTADTLIKAQQNPDAYRGLVVRVAGYSAFFVELDKDIQDEIISRTEQNGI